MLATLSFWVMFSGLSEANLNTLTEVCYKQQKTLAEMSTTCRELAYYMHHDWEAIEAVLVEAGEL